MTTYDLKTLTAQAAAQFDGTESTFAAIQAICRDARLDRTEQMQVRVPTGSFGVARVMRKGDWIFSVSTGVFVVMDNLSFAAIWAASA